MKPANNRYFGSSSGAIQITFNDGSGVTTGYIDEQVSWAIYRVSRDGSSFHNVQLAQSSGAAENLQPGYGTIKVTLPNGTTEYVRKLFGGSCSTMSGSLIGCATETAGRPDLARLDRVGVSTTPSEGSFAARYLLLGI